MQVKYCQFKPNTVENVIRNFAISEVILLRTIAGKTGIALLEVSECKWYS